MALFHADYETENDMSNTNQNTQPNTTATAEAARLSGDNSLVARFEGEAKALGIASSERETAQEKESQAIMACVVTATEAALTIKGIKPSAFLPQELDKAGNIKTPMGKFGKGVANKSQANKITAMAFNKKVKAAVVKATPAGTKANKALIESVFTAKGWASYKKMKNDVTTARIVKLNKEGVAMEKAIDNFVREYCKVNNLDYSNDDNTSTKTRIKALTEPKAE